MRDFFGRLQRAGKVALAIPLMIVWIPLWVVFMIIYQGLLRPLMRVYLVMAVALQWRPQGKLALFVYSDSPNWKPYLEQFVIPVVKERVVLLNWSERKKWNKPLSGTLEVMIFRHWAYSAREQNYSEFNPMAVVFVPWYAPKALRFFRAFRYAKRGDLGSLTALEEELFDKLGVEAPAREYF